MRPTRAMGAGTGEVASRHLVLTGGGRLRIVRGGVAAVRAEPGSRLQLTAALYAKAANSPPCGAPWFTRGYIGRAHAATGRTSIAPIRASLFPLCRPGGGNATSGRPGRNHRPVNRYARAARRVGGGGRRAAAVPTAAPVATRPPSSITPRRLGACGSLPITSSCEAASVIRPFFDVWPSAGGPSPGKSHRRVRVSRPTVVRSLPLWAFTRKPARQRDLVAPTAQKYAAECCPLGDVGASRVIVDIRGSAAPGLVLVARPFSGKDRDEPPRSRRSGK